MSTSPTLRTRVVFRHFKGEVLALFPEIAGNSNPDFCLSYAAQGQHGAAHYAGVIASSKPAKPAQYRTLAAELRRAGYALEIATRAKGGDWHARFQAGRSPRS